MRCVSVVPVLFEAGPAAAADTLAVAFDAPRVLLDPPQRLSVRVRDATTRPGERVRVEVEVEGGGLRQLQWWVDGGELLETARTQTWLPEGQGDPPTDSVSANEVVVPTDWQGPLRVVVVAQGDDFTASSWGMATVWVGEAPEACTAALDVLAYRPDAPTQVLPGWQGDLWLQVADVQGAPVASAVLRDVDLATAPRAVSLAEVPCEGPDTQVTVSAFLDTNQDGDPDEEIDPWGVLAVEIGAGTLHDLAIAVVGP